MTILDRWRRALFGQPWRPEWHVYRESLQITTSAPDAHGQITVTATDPISGAVTSATNTSASAAQSVLLLHLRSQFAASHRPARHTIQ